MSFILDALKKSESERQQQRGANFVKLPSSDDSPGVPRWLWVLILLLVINLIVLAGLMFRKTPTTELPPSTLPKTLKETSSSEGAAPQATFEDRIQSAVSERRQMEPTEALPSSTELSSPTETPTNSVDIPLDVPVDGFTDTPLVTNVPAVALPTANDLRLDGRLPIGDLHLDLHVYDAEPSNRFVFINMVKHRENSRLAEGPVVKKITPEGVVLDHAGTEFLLPRE